MVLFFVPSATQLWTATTPKLFCNSSFCDFPVIALIDTCLFQPLLSRDPILVKSQKWLYAMSPPQQQCPLRNAMFKNGFRRHIHIYSLFRSYKMEIKPQYNIKESIFTKKYIINPILATFREFREIVEFDPKMVKSSLNRLGEYIFCGSRFICNRKWCIWRLGIKKIYFPPIGHNNSPPEPKNTSLFCHNV